MQSKISPSMMCAGIIDIKNTLNSFEQCSIEYLHIDIMDGHFVPNFTLGTDYCRLIRKETDIPLDIHLMVEKPEEKIDWFEIKENDIVSVHIESTCHIQKVLNAIKSKGAKAFVALNPGTPLTSIEDILDSIDGVLIMTVNPGFAGQKMVPSSPEKIRKTRDYLDSKGYTETEIEVDGNVSFENAVKMKQSGANIFVGGSSSVFCKETDISENIAKMREII